MKSARAKLKAGLNCDLQKHSVLESGHAFLVKKPHVNTKLKLVRVEEGGASTS